MDVSAILTWGQKVDAVIHPLPITVELIALMPPTLLNVTVMKIAFILRTVVMTSLKLDVLVRQTACTLHNHA